MKHLLIILLLAVTGLSSVQAQSFTEKQSSGFDISTAVDNGITIDIEGETFDVYQTNKGSQFIKAVSSKGKDYPLWIGSKTTHEFDGKPVRQFNSGTYCYLHLKDGKPRVKYLDKN